MKRRQSSDTKNRVALIDPRSIVENRRRVLNQILAGLICLCVLAQQALSFGSATQTISVGVFEFQNESGAGLPAGFARKIARDLARKLNADYKDLIVRHFNNASDSSSITALTVDQLAALGKQQGIKFIIRGGLLDVSQESPGGEMKSAIQLYADIVSVETLTIKSIRSEGTSAADDRALSSEQALSNAVGQLATLIHQEIVSPLPGPTAAGSLPQAPVEASGQGDSKDVAAGESDEELRQLIAQAELLVADGPTVNRERLAALSQALAALKAALKSKATVLEEGMDIAAADQEVAEQSEELQASVSALAQDETPAGPGEMQDQQSSGEKKNLLARVSEYAGEALNIIQKIQEMRAAFRVEGGYQNEPSAAAPPGEGALPTVEPVEDITGVVTELGEPVGGITVIEPESGVSTITDINGSFALKEVAAGRLAKLVLTRSGKQIATGQIDLMRGRSAIADFELKPQATGQPAMRVIPSTVLVARAKSRDGSVGVVKGVVQDGQGRPMARALVSLKGLAMARTDSQGHYVFLNAPSGAHQLIIHRNGLKPKAMTVQVAAKKSSESKTQFTAADKIHKAGNRLPLLLPGTGTVLRGTVRDNQNRAVTGAKITFVQQGSAVAVFAGPQGNYTLRDIKPGSYRVLVSKAGYEALAQTVILQAGEGDPRNFQLSKSDSPIIEKALAARQRNKNQAPRDANKFDKQNDRNGLPRNGIIAPKETSPVQAKRGSLRGRVSDSKTGKAISGATVSIQGRQRTKTDEEGSYNIFDLPVGSYRINVSRAGFSEQEKSVKVLASASTQENFVLVAEAINDKRNIIIRPRLPAGPVAAREGQLRGRIVDAKTGKPLAGAFVSVARQRPVTSDREGFYAFADLAAGAHEVIARKGDFFDGVASIVIRPGEATTANFRLSPRPRIRLR